MCCMYVFLYTLESTNMRGFTKTLKSSAAAPASLSHDRTDCGQTVSIPALKIVNQILFI